jgi:hypothetical protein
LASGCDRFLINPAAFNVLDRLLDEALGDVTQQILPVQSLTVRD